MRARLQDGDTCIVAHWRKVLAQKGFSPDEVEALTPVVYRCSSHFNTNTNKLLDKIHKRIAGLGSKVEGEATKQHFAQVDRRLATFAKAMLPRYDAR